MASLAALTCADPEGHPDSDFIASEDFEKELVREIHSKSSINSQSQVAHAWLEVHATIKHHSALLLTLPHDFMSRAFAQTDQTEIMFLADRSGSMVNDMAPLKSALRFFLKGIPLGRKFNVWSFGSDHVSWAPRCVEYTEKNLNAAVSYLEREFKADMGGTEMYPALRAMIKSRDRSISTDIIVLTDGQTDCLKDTLELVRKTHESTAGAVRFFCLGLGDHVSRDLVQGVADRGGGYAEFINTAATFGWEHKLVLMTKLALTCCHITQLEFWLHIDTGEDIQYVNLGTATHSTADVANLGCFNHNRIWMLIEEAVPSMGTKTVWIRASMSRGEPRWAAIPVPVSYIQHGTTIQQQAAKAVLGGMRERNEKSYKPKSSRKLRKKAEEIASHWSIEPDLAKHLSQGQPDTELLPEHTGEHSGGMNLSNIDTWVPSPEPVIVFVNENDCDSYHHGPVPSPTEANWTQAEEDSVRAMLDFQNFDGSFGFEAQDDASTVLGASVVDAVEGLVVDEQEDPQDRVAAYTATIAMLLERDFASLKPLWTLMLDKAFAFLEQRPGLYDEAQLRERLQHAKICPEPLTHTENHAIDLFQQEVYIGEEDQATESTLRKPKKASPKASRARTGEVNELLQEGTCHGPRPIVSGNEPDVMQSTMTPSETRALSISEYTTPAADESRTRPHEEQQAQVQRYDETYYGHGDTRCAEEQHGEGTSLLYEDTTQYSHGEVDHEESYVEHIIHHGTREESQPYKHSKLHPESWASNDQGLSYESFETPANDRTCHNSIGERKQTEKKTQRSKTHQHSNTQVHLRDSPAKRSKQRQKEHSPHLDASLSSEQYVHGQLAYRDSIKDVHHLWQQQELDPESTYGGNDDRGLFDYQSEPRYQHEYDDASAEHQPPRDQYGAESSAKDDHHFHDGEHLDEPLELKYQSGEDRHQIPSEDVQPQSSGKRQDKPRSNRSRNEGSRK